jgi:dynein heavy chain
MNAKMSSTPQPRGEHAACQIKGKVYIFGGYGGPDWSRRDFNDLYGLDTISWSWDVVNPGNQFFGKKRQIEEEENSDSDYEPEIYPEPRAAHTLSPLGEDQLVLFGGWNSREQFSDVWIFSLETKRWSELEIAEPLSEPRWSHGAIVAESIPHDQLYVYGGLCGEITKKNVIGKYSTDLWMLDLIDGRWTKVKCKKPPKPRADSELAFNDASRSIFVFGGWANKWHKDMWSLDSGPYVGPPYNMESCTPGTGPILGGTELTLTGVGFKPGRGLKIKFQGGVFGEASAFASYVSETEMTVITPDLSQFLRMPGKDNLRVVNVALSINEDLNTIYPIMYKIFTLTDATNTLSFGPALMDGAFAGQICEAIIITIDQYGNLRTSAGDTFTIKVVQVIPPETYSDEEFAAEKEAEEDEDENVVKSPEKKVVLPPTRMEVEGVEVEDLGNGQHVVRWIPPAANVYEIDISYDGTFGGVPGPLGQGPWEVKVEEANEKVAEDAGRLASTSFLNKARSMMTDTIESIDQIDKDLSAEVVIGDVSALLRAKETISLIDNGQAEKERQFEAQRQLIEYLGTWQGADTKADLRKLEAAEVTWSKLRKLSGKKADEIKPAEKATGQQLTAQLEDYEKETYYYKVAFRDENPFWGFDVTYKEATKSLDAAYALQEKKRAEYDKWRGLAEVFGLTEFTLASKKDMKFVDNSLKGMRALWESVHECRTTHKAVTDVIWCDIDTEKMEITAKKMVKGLRKIPKDLRQSECFIGFSAFTKGFANVVPLLASLSHDSMRDRHWDMIRELVKNPDLKNFTSPLQDPEVNLQSILGIGLEEISVAVDEIADQAVKELKMEKSLAALSEQWSVVEFFAEESWEGSGVYMLNMKEDDIEMLENDQLTVQGMMGSRFLSTFETEVTTWQKELAAVDEVMQLLGEVQRLWSYLEPLFIRSAEVKSELPVDAERFVGIDRDVRQVLKDAHKTMMVKDACNKEGLFALLEDVESRLNLCKRSLMDFLDAKRTQFPRFYFMSEADLLDVLSNGSTPSKIVHHVTKIYLKVKKINLVDVPGQKRPTTSKLWATCGGEKMDFDNKIILDGKPENYLQALLDEMTSTLQHKFKISYARSTEQSRVDWLMNAEDDGHPTDPGQLTLLVAFQHHVAHVEKAIPTGTLKEYAAKQIRDLSDLVNLTVTSLSKNERQRVMCMITMDAHGRDIVEKLIRIGVEKVSHFEWQGQLKPRRDENGDAKWYVLNAIFPYGYEYIGNDGRLVVTPLTDRIYVTSSTGLSLKMGVAPAGPAGTGKTETVKDLAMNFGYNIYVFNCSPEMDYISLGNVFKGLAATGSWGCFDEFNRLRVEVLSVATVQFKAVCDSLRAGNPRVTIEGDTVDCRTSVGVFITMNPGYIGRAELPEGLKALFRPMTVMVPDMVLICENMLMAEGFQTAKSLASKFYGLYSLLRDLLSKQRFYDWGLRAVKSVLRVAGGFKRAEPDIDEQLILMRALRDFNVPKIAQQDMVIFFGLLGDLFPGINPPRKIDQALEDAVLEATEELKLWPDEVFLLKVVQLEELLFIRHCVFILGPPGAGKSTVWKTLGRAKSNRGQKTKIQDINPKSITSQELYGYISKATREWKDGLLSKYMRDLGLEKDTNPKWICLDGDLDTNWIESMNSVMDMNKMLTLASNERIPLKPHMKMLFEIRDLRFASLATVTRAGVLYISADKGTQWRSLISSWIQSRSDDSDTMKAVWKSLFKETVEKTLFYLKAMSQPIVPVEDMAYVNALLNLLEILLTPEYVKEQSNNKDEKDLKTKLQIPFTFACIWAFGGPQDLDKDGVNYSQKFSDWWARNFTKVKIPSRSSVYDSWLDPSDQTFKPWEESPFYYPVSYSSSTAMETVTVPTSETCSTTFWVEALLAKSVPTMLVGPAGVGKTQLIDGVLEKLDPELRKSQDIKFNFFTDGRTLQLTMESHLVKKVGTNYGPPGKAKLVFFIDDFNLPEVDIYDTQSSIALMRQVIEYHRWYDRIKLGPKHILDCQYIASMNQTSGSFFINPRLQRHFVTFANGMPGPQSLTTIFSTFLDGHLKDFADDIKNISKNVVTAALAMDAAMTKGFKKTAKNFYYQFNMRHIAGIFQGMMMSRPEIFNGNPNKFAILFLHEAERIYGDRLVSVKDVAAYNKLAANIAKSKFPFAAGDIGAFFAAEAKPLIMCHFAQSTDKLVYDQSHEMKTLTNILKSTLAKYNDENAAMDLVLFEDAVRHVCRISRIIMQPGGHALLVGVGGMGKRSLARLAAYICQFSLELITITQTYGISDLKEDLQKFYWKAGVKGQGVLFLFTDSQITKERFLIYINDLLASGRIPDLYEVDQRDEIINSLTKDAKAAGIDPEPASIWEYFFTRVRANLHMALAFSPVGDDFRNRAMKFPAIINATVIDYFQAWPEEALLGVATQFLAEEELGDKRIHKGIAAFMPFAFKNVNQMAEHFLEKEKRYVYTTPKSFLECVSLYTSLLKEKREASESGIERLEAGVHKLKITAEAVAQIESELVIQLDGAEKAKEAADAIATTVGIEKAKVAEETAGAAEEEKKCADIQIRVEGQREEANIELMKAEPAINDAMAALNTLNKKDLGMAKTMNTAPTGVGEVFACVATLLANCEFEGHINMLAENIVTDKKGRVKDKSWGACKKQLLGNIPQFLGALMDFKECIDAHGVPECNIEYSRPMLAEEEFDPEIIMGRNSAAAGLCSWCINIVLYADIFKKVEPLRIALDGAQAELDAATEKLVGIRKRVAELQEKLAGLAADFDAASKSKEEAIETVRAGKERLDLAQRLTRALGSEGVRWSANILALQRNFDLLVGDVLLASAFISYVGPFTKPYRTAMLEDYWVPFMNQAALFAEKFGDDEDEEKTEEKKEEEVENDSDEEDNKEVATPQDGIPMSEDCNPLLILTNEKEIAQWRSNKLPADRVSTENASIVTNSARWPLVIDPQLQAIKWISDKEKDRELEIVRMDNKQLIRKLIYAMENGKSLMIENLLESIDAILTPVVTRACTKRGRKKYIRLGDDEVEMHEDFRFFLHTKLSNPHYPPEIQAETALINFTVTESGLEEQLLNMVVGMERPDLAEERLRLIDQQNGFKIQMAKLEDDILHKLATAEGDITEDRDLIEGLENTKAVSNEIKIKQKLAAATSEIIQATTNKYRSVGARASLLFFLLNGMFKIHTYYIYDLESFVTIYQRAVRLCGEPDDILKGKPAEESDLTSPTGSDKEEEDGDKEVQEEGGEEDNGLQAEIDEAIVQRCGDLIASVQKCVYDYTRRGLLEKDKLTIATMLTLKIALDEKRVKKREIDYLVESPLDMSAERPELIEEYMTEIQWRRAVVLDTVSNVFTGFGERLQDDADQWKKWIEHSNPEDATIPGMKDISQFNRLLVLRALRPDRLVVGLKVYVRGELGNEYVEQPPFDMDAAYKEMSKTTPMFFVLFPGVDPTVWIEAQGEKEGFTIAKGNLISISMGEGQEKGAMDAMDKLSAEGGWIFLQNLHLMEQWTPLMERKLEKLSETSHKDFRVFTNAEPPPFSFLKNMPEGFMMSSIKIANEAPSDVQSNIQACWATFNQSMFDESHQPDSYKACLHTLSFYHAIILGRRRFGQIGWSRAYSFNMGDLRCCKDVANDYLEVNETIPFEDLRYVWGAIMYGGHITDAWDRRTNNAYLEVLMVPGIFKNMLLCPGYKAPDPRKFDYKGVSDYVTSKLPLETPVMFRMHANAEVGYLITNVSELFQQVILLGGVTQYSGGSKGSKGGGQIKVGGKKKKNKEGGDDAESKVKAMLIDLLGKLPENYNMVVLKKDAEPNLEQQDAPYTLLLLQEITRMNTLLSAMRTSMIDLQKGLNGELNMSEGMEHLLEALTINQVPGRNVFHRTSWEKHAWWSNKTLATWFPEMIKRNDQFWEWREQLIMPYCMWFPGLFNPMAYLTAVMQITGRVRSLPLDKMTTETHVTLMTDTKTQSAHPEDGVFAHGLYIEGARWGAVDDEDEACVDGEPDLYEITGVKCGGHVCDSHLFELMPLLPVMYFKAVMVDPEWEPTNEGYLRHDASVYDCPLYVTRFRGPTYTVMCQMKSVDDPNRWILAGCAIICQEDE